jgi:hypothetical protein
LRKDRADILALLDPEGGGQEVDVLFLGEIMKRHPFLIDCIEKVALDVEVVEFYQRMDQDSAENLIERLLSLIG